MNQENNNIDSKALDQAKAKAESQASKKVRTPESVQKLNRREITKIVVFNVINIILLVVVIFIIRRIPQEAEKVKNLRSEEIAAQESLSVGVLQAEIERNREKILELREVFVDEGQFISFVTSLEAIRAEGIITDVSFPVVNPVEDNDGNPGLPVSIVARGNIDQLNNAIGRVMSLPFLIRTVNANLEVVNAEEQIYVLRSGLFLYVDEEFSQN